MASAPPTSTLLAGLDWLAAHRDLIAARGLSYSGNDDGLTLYGKKVADVADALALAFDRYQVLGIEGVRHANYCGTSDGVWVRMVSVERAS